MRQLCNLHLKPFLFSSRKMTRFDRVFIAFVRSRNGERSLATRLIPLLSKYISEAGDSVLYIHFYVSILIYMFVTAQALCDRIKALCDNAYC